MHSFRSGSNLHIRTCNHHYLKKYSLRICTMCIGNGWDLRRGMAWAPVVPHNTLIQSKWSVVLPGPPGGALTRYSLRSILSRLPCWEPTESRWAGTSWMVLHSSRRGSIYFIKTFSASYYFDQLLRRDSDKDL